MVSVKSRGEDLGTKSIEDAVSDIKYDIDNKLIKEVKLSEENKK